MKQKFLLSLLFVCSLVVTTNAQINKGATWLGGQVSFGHSSTENAGSKNKQTSFNIGPAVGKAVKDNLIVGIAANYQHYKTKNGSVTTNKGTTYGGALFIRKYVPVVNRFYIFGDARAYFNVSSERTSDIKIKGWDAGISATPGLSYGVTKNIQIETGLNSLFRVAYMKRNQEQGYNENKNNAFNAGISLDNTSPIYLGFRFLINKKA
jgi:hypothetical protein